MPLSKCLAERDVIDRSPVQILDGEVKQKIEPTQARSTYCSRRKYRNSSCSMEMDNRSFNKSFNIDILHSANLKEYIAACIRI